MKAKHKLEHIVFNSWKKKRPEAENSKILVAVSGGRDSMTLLRCMISCFPKDKLVVVHCHHGRHENVEHRDLAQKLVETFCTENGILCLVKINENQLTSEAEFREFRLDTFKTLAQQFATQIVCLAHHQDDWLENQLIKLIRGSSFSTLKQSFQWSRLASRSLLLWRPFYQCRRTDLESYQKVYQVPYVEDPSNSESRYFRNWIRNIWLQSLEETRPGSTNRLAKSLIHSIAEITPSNVAFPWNSKTNSIDLIYFLSLSEAEKLRCLAFCVHSKGISSVKSSQLKEVIRQLDKNSDRYHINFKTFSCTVNAGQLVLNFKVVK